MATTEPLDATGLEIALRPAQATLHLAGGRTLPFTDGVLVLRNATGMALEDLRATATVRQEGAILAAEEVPLGQAGSWLPAGASLERGLYELLQALDRGLASRVHLWGPKAVLNWPFHLSLEVSWRAGGEAHRTACACGFRWTQPEGPDGAFALELDPD